MALLLMMWSSSRVWASSRGPPRRMWVPVAFHSASSKVSSCQSACILSRAFSMDHSLLACSLISSIACMGYSPFYPGLPLGSEATTTIPSSLSSPCISRLMSFSFFSFPVFPFLIMFFECYSPSFLPFFSTAQLPDDAAVLLVVPTAQHAERGGHKQGHSIARHVHSRLDQDVAPCSADPSKPACSIFHLNGAQRAGCAFLKRPCCLYSQGKTVQADT